MPHAAMLPILILVAAAAHAGQAARPLDLAPATPEQVLNHHLVRSARLGQAATPDGLVPLMPWRTADDVVEGWDWSLPPGIQPVPRSGLIFGGREKRRFPGNKLADVAVFWRDVEPEEGRYAFEKLRKRLESLPEGVVGCRFHFYASVSHRISRGRRQPIGPAWLATHNIPTIDMTSMEGRFQLFNYAIWHEDYHRRYLRVIQALGRSGIPKLDGLRIVYVGAISKSWGEEFYIPRDVAAWCEKNAGLTPAALETCLAERLDAWARAFKGVEHKLAWVGAGSGGVGGRREYARVAERVMRRAYELGMGQRCGFVENYLYHLHNPWLGQSVDPQGYLAVDETCPPIAHARAFGDENEEYGRYWTGRFGPLETHPYRYHQSMIRTLQMRRNYLWMSPASVDMDPALTAYVSLELGRRVSDAPDAFCCLRESTVRAGAAGKKGRTAPIRNFERWLRQRDRDGYRTVPALKATQHTRLWMVPDGHRFDWLARRTDLASGNPRIGFIVHDRFLLGGPHRVAVKITWHDRGRGTWALVYPTGPATTSQREVQCRDTGKVFTSTFHLADAWFPAKGEAFDFHIQARTHDATISFVRLIKANGETAHERR